MTIEPADLQTNVKPLTYVDTSTHIPIHGSDRATFKRCRQAWEFSAPSRYNLVPKITYEGISFPLWFGSLIHKALEEYYHPVVRRHPVEVFQTAYHDGIYDSKNRRVIYGVNQITRLNPSFYELERESFEYHLELGTNMLDFYLTWAPDRDEDFEILSTEADFAIPMGTAVDVRDNIEKPIWYKGRMDAVVRSKSSGQISIMDHKTAASMTEDYFQKLELDEQCTSYIWAAQRTLGERVGEISGIWYNVLRKAAPSSPTITKSGKPSISRTEESTTPRLWMQAIEDHNLQAWFQTNEKAQAYYAYLVEMGDSQFIQRHFVPRNQYEIKYFESQLMDELHDMTRDPKLYRNPSGDFLCTKCAFRSPCIAKGDGSDWKFMLEQNFQRNSDR